MKRTASFVIIMLTLLALTTGPAPIHGQVLDRADLSISVDRASVLVHINLHMYQNLTLLENEFTLPPFHVVIGSSNSSSILGELQNAIRERNSQAQVAGLALDATIGAWSNASSRQWFNQSLTFKVEGVTVDTGGSSQADLSWKSFATKSDINVDGHELNNIGASYLEAIAGQIGREQTGSALLQVSFQVNGRVTGNAGFAPLVAQMNVFNFSSIDKTVSSWKDNATAFAQTRMWALSSKPNLGMTFIRTSTEPPVGERALYGLFYSLSGEVSAPRGSTVQSDLVNVPLDTGSEYVMGLTVVSAIVLGSGAWLYERRLTGPSFKKKPRRK